MWEYPLWSGYCLNKKTQKVINVSVFDIQLIKNAGVYSIKVNACVF